MSEAPEDIIERMQIIANLRTGDQPPPWLFRNDDSSWADGMSRLLNDAIAEIKRLRGTA